jgi:hypothetical protein
MQKLKDWAYSDQLTKRGEYFVLEKEITKERLLADRRYLLDMIENAKTSDRVRLYAIRTEMELNTALLRLEYDGKRLINDLMRARQVSHGSSGK